MLPTGGTVGLRKDFYGAWLGLGIEILTNVLTILDSSVAGGSLQLMADQPDDDL